MSENTKFRPSAKMSRKVWKCTSPQAYNALGPKWAKISPDLAKFRPSAKMSKKVWKCTSPQAYNALGPKWTKISPDLAPHSLLLEGSFSLRANPLREQPRAEGCSCFPWGERCSCGGEGCSCFPWGEGCSCFPWGEGHNPRRWEHETSHCSSATNPFRWRLIFFWIHLTIIHTNDYSQSCIFTLTQPLISQLFQVY